MASKTFKIGYDASGATLYALVRQQSTGYYYDNPVNDIFVPGPSDPYLIMAEDSLLTGFYLTTVADGTVWDNGVYDVVFYEQLGVSPNLAADVQLGNNQFEIKNDAILTLNELGASLADEIFKTQLSLYRNENGSFGQKQALDASDPIREYN